MRENEKKIEIMNKNLKEIFINKKFKNSMNNIINIKENKRRVQYQNRSQPMNNQKRNSFQMKLF